MINLDDFINAINNTIDPKKGVLVLHRSVKMHPKFKICKIFTYSLYNIVGEKHCIHSIEIAKNASCEELLEVWEKTNKEYLQELILFIDSDNYKNLKNV